MNDQIILQDISFIRSNWLKTRFIKNKLIYKTSRYLIAISINYLLECDERKLCKQNNNIYRSIEETNQHIRILKNKFNKFNDISILFHIPLNIYFEQRMTRLRQSADRHMKAVRQEVREEVEHWRNIHSILSQPFLEPGLLRSYPGGLPQQIQQSPSSEINTIYEENEQLKSSKKSNRCLASINTFSILSNGINREYLSPNRFNKTFVKVRSSINDSLADNENLTSMKSLNTSVAYKNISDFESDTTDDTVIFAE